MMLDYDAKMRTTVTIDDNLLAEAKSFAAKQHRTLGEVIDEALRMSLRQAAEPRKQVELPTTGDPRNRPLVDILDKEALAEVLGDNEWPRRDDAHT
jgi:hypothetical protein